MIPASTRASMSRKTKQSNSWEPWTGYLIIAADLDPNHCMTPTFDQEDTTHLRIGSFAILIVTPAKSLLIGWRIWCIEQGPIYRHEPIASKERFWCLIPTC